MDEEEEEEGEEGEEGEEVEEEVYEEEEEDGGSVSRETLNGAGGDSVRGSSKRNPSGSFFKKICSHFFFFMFYAISRVLHVIKRI